MNLSSLNRMFLPLILCACLLSIGATFAAHHAKKEIVEFDINDTIATFQQNLTESQLSDEKRDSEIQRFTQTLEEVVKQYAAEHNVIVLVSPAIVSGAENVTQDIQLALLAALKHQMDVKQSNNDVKIAMSGGQ